MALSCLTVIQAKNVGVLTTFGKVSERTLDPGIHPKLPWQKVTEIDGTWQPDEYKGDDCIYALIGDGSRACFSLTNRWRVLGERANTSYSEYRSDNPTETLRSAVVSTQLKAAVLEVASTYNPTAELQVVEGEEAEAASDANFAPNYAEFENLLMASMERRLGENPLVEIDSITISYVGLSESTQQKINEFTAEIARTRIAGQRVETAKKEAEANQELSDSISNDPNVLVSKCLDMVAEGGVSLPANFQCWPGGGGAVVVPGTTK